MKNYGYRNVRKHINIMGSDKYVTLEISLKFDSMDKMKITSSESKDILGRSGKGLITYLGLKAKASLNKYKKSRYSIGIVSMKNPSEIIRVFEKLTYKSYERRREAQTWAHRQLLLPNKADCEVYDHK